MNAPATVTPMNKAPTLGVAQVYLQGRIAYARTSKTENGRLFLTILKIPAVDQYSHPATVEVSSTTKLGEINDDWKGVCQVGGYPRTYDGKPDPETGEVRTIRTATINLRVVEG
ncbi:MAG: hypothetical protein HZC43_02235 [Nitrosomonadales bacterium]|nr:hypothetical protein [Nitrosomonadales bacterium]